MTTVYTVTKTCYVCNSTNEYYEVSSTSTFGSSDLDTRPPQMERSTIDFWIEECPSCGYCAPDVSTGPWRISDILESKEYKKKAKKPSYPDLARKFLCWSTIQELLGEYCGAGWTALYAAWACDDAQAPEKAELCRKEAIRLLEKALDDGVSFAEQPGEEELVMVDLLRRSGQFEKAEVICKQGLAKVQDEIIKQGLVKMQDETIKRALLFEQILLESKDRECYTVEQAIGMSRERPSFRRWLDSLDQKGIGGE